MNKRILSRILAVVVMGLFFAFLLYQSHEADRMLGKDGFLAQEASAFDNLYSTPPSLGLMIFNFGLSTVFIGLYEVVANLLYLLISWNSSTDLNQSS